MDSASSTGVVGTVSVPEFCARPSLDKGNAEYFSEFDLKPHVKLLS